MIRKLITVAVPLLAPVALYLLWSWQLRRRGKDGEAIEDPFSWHEVPWVWLGAIGTALLAATLVISTLVWHEGVGGDYTPPRFEDGKRIPGSHSR
jgi:hypothetical protein